MSTNLYEYYKKRYGSTYYVPEEIYKESRKFTYSTILWLLISSICLFGIIYAYMLFSTIPPTSQFGRPNSFYGLIVLMVVLTIFLIVSTLTVYVKYREFKWVRYLYKLSNKTTTEATKKSRGLKLAPQQEQFLTESEIIELFNQSGLADITYEKMTDVVLDVHIGATGQNRIISLFDLAIIDTYNKYIDEGLDMLSDILLHYSFYEAKGINRRGVIDALFLDLQYSQTQLSNDLNYLDEVLRKEYGEDTCVKNVISQRGEFIPTKEDMLTLFFYSSNIPNRIYRVNNAKKIITTLDTIYTNLYEYNTFVSSINESNIKKLNKHAYNEIIDTYKDMRETTTVYIASIEQHHNSNISAITNIVTLLEQLTKNIDVLYHKNLVVK